MEKGRVGNGEGKVGMRALLLWKAKEVRDRKEKGIGRRKARGGREDLPDQCQTASYAPVTDCIVQPRFLQRIAFITTLVVSDS